MNGKPKKIIIEALAAGLIPCGLREYAFQVCTRLIKIAPDWMSLSFIVPKGMSGCFGPDAEYIETTPFMAKVMRNIPLLKADLFHALHQICAVKHLPGVDKQLMTIHDVNFRHTKSGRSYNHAEGRFISRLKYASHLAFISRFASEDVTGHFPCSLPSKIIYNGVTPPDISRETKPASAPEGNFLLHLSSLDEYKNARLLVEMMDFLPDRTLVLAGNCKDSTLPALAAKRPNVIMTGKVTDGEKTWLYNHCDAFLFPSKAEGFGLPPLEAMSLGKPVFLSTLTSLPEIGGNQAFYWPQLEPEAMAAQLKRQMLLPVDTDALKCHVATFSWDMTAAEYIKYYSEILAE